MYNLLLISIKTIFYIFYLSRIFILKKIKNDLL